MNKKNRVLFSSANKETKNNLLSIFNRNVDKEYIVFREDQIEIRFLEISKEKQYYILKEMMKAIDEKKQYKTNITEHEIYYYSRIYKTLWNHSNTKHIK